MQKNVLLTAATIFMMAISIVSCKKTALNDESTENVKIAAAADKQSRFSKELTSFANDANILLQSRTSIHGKIENEMGGLCNVTASVDSSGSSYITTLNYNGLNCAGTGNFTGLVVLTILKTVNWRDAGATMACNFQNLKIVRVTYNKSININGLVNVTNESGGKIADLPTRGNITNTITGSNIKVTFDDNTYLTVQEATQRNYTLNNGVVVITTTGTHTEGTVSGVSEWGADNTGAKFVTAYTKPLVMKQDCDYRIGNGEATTTKPDGKSVITFGLDATGAPTACPGTTGIYYFKTDWIGNNGDTSTALAAY